MLMANTVQGVQANVAMCKQFSATFGFCTCVACCDVIDATTEGSTHRPGGGSGVAYETNDPSAAVSTGVVEATALGATAIAAAAIVLRGPRSTGVELGKFVVLQKGCPVAKGSTCRGSLACQRPPSPLDPDESDHTGLRALHAFVTDLAWGQGA
jgi:hypothetical protein